MIPLCDEPLYRSISDKYSFGNLCQKYDLQIPYEYNSITNVDYPFVIKAKKYFGATRSVNEKPIIINSEAEFKNIENSLDLKSYYFQKFIGGKSIYLLFYISKSGNYSVYSQENLIQQNNGLSIVAAVSSDIHESEISEKYAKMLIEEGFFGLIMIELKKYNENYYMIEANPRLWGPSQLILDSGMDLFYQFANDNNLINSPKKKDYKLGTKYYWSGGIFLDEQNAVANVFHDYSSDKFSKNRSQFEKNDIYKKDDTKLIYESELI
ncbi:MAG: ATP-grasp domain-containing protein [Ignavibacteriales bacterium]|nr:ATP-grasp domain-containing protein [Ignavibacteriales bacterium]